MMGGKLGIVPPAPNTREVIGVSYTPPPTPALTPPQSCQDIECPSLTLGSIDATMTPPANIGVAYVPKHPAP